MLSVPTCRARRPWNPRRDFNVHRGVDLLNKYHMAGEGVYNYAYGAQVPGFQGVPERPLICDRIGWGGFNVPEAAPALPPPISSDVQCIIDNMLRLQHMAPDKAAKILRGAEQLCLRSPGIRISGGARNHDRLHREAICGRLLCDEYNDAKLESDDAHVRRTGCGGFNAPEAAPALPPPISSGVQCIIDNMLHLQHLAPEQAAKILLEDLFRLLRRQMLQVWIQELRALCTVRETL